MDPSLHFPVPVRFLAFLAAVLVTGTWAFARHIPRGAHVSAVVENVVRRQEVASVSIDTPRAPRSERRLPLAELRGLLATQPGKLLDEQALAADRRALEQALIARGYLAAKVAPPSVTFSATGAAYVVFDVERGPMYHLRKISVTGPGEALDIVTLSPHDEAVPARIERAKQILEDALAARATRSHVEVRLHEDHAAASVDVELATTVVTVVR